MDRGTPAGKQWAVGSSYPRSVRFLLTFSSTAQDCIGSFPSCESTSKLRPPLPPPPPRLSNPWLAPGDFGFIETLKIGLSIRSPAQVRHNRRRSRRRGLRRRGGQL